MSQLITSDTTFKNLYESVLRELKEPLIGSEAVPLDLAKDKVNEVYMEVFNDQRMKQSARENDVSFSLSPDQSIVNDINAGSTTVQLTDVTGWQSSGSALLLSDVISYTGIDTSTNTLTGVTGLTIKHYAGEAIRQMYKLSTIATDIDEEQIHYLDVNGIIQYYMSYDQLITQINFFPNTYTVYKGNLLFSRQSSLGNPARLSNSLMIYSQKVTPMSTDSDKPTLIPNSYRTPVLVYGACMKIAAADAYKTSWDWWKSEYEKGVKQYIAFKNCRVRDVNNRRRPTVYTSNMSMNR